MSIILYQITVIILCLLLPITWRVAQKRALTSLSANKALPAIARSYVAHISKTVPAFKGIDAEDVFYLAQLSANFTKMYLGFTHKHYDSVGKMKFEEKARRE